jgi:hypothetical protein
MGFVFEGKPLAEWTKLREAERLSHIRQEIQDLVNRPELITYAEYENLRGNSWEWEAIYTRLDNEALIKAVEHHLSNCSREYKRPVSTYDDSIREILVPILIERLRAIGK